MLECISLVVMYAKLLNIIKGSIDPLIEGLLISIPLCLLTYLWILRICPPSKEKFPIYFGTSFVRHLIS